MPDAILLDGHLATMSGVAMLATLRALPNGRKPCILYCTTENDTSALARALSAGADDYLLKPSIAKASAPSWTRRACNPDRPGMTPSRDLGKGVASGRTLPAPIADGEVATRRGR
jgi:hypothetical protein